MEERNELERCYEIVWKFRSVVSEWWPTPDKLSATRYACTEGGEVMEAFLRKMRPGDSRNNERNIDMLDEMADLAIMLITALGPDCERLGDTQWKLTVDQLVSMMVITDDPNYDHLLETQLMGVACFPGIELEQRIKERLTRIFGNHVQGKAENAGELRKEALWWEQEGEIG